MNDLPCRWREETNTGYICNSPAITALEEITLDTCSICYLRDHPEKGKFESKLEKPKLRDDCKHKGEFLFTQECPTCAGSVKIKVFSCSIHNECTIAKTIDQKACCSTCLDYTTIDSEVK